MKYTTILLDVENLLIFLDRVPKNEKEKMEKRIQADIRKLDGYKIIGMAPFQQNKAETFFKRNYLSDIFLPRIRNYMKVGSRKCDQLNKKKDRKAFNMNQQTVDSFYLSTLIKKLELQKEDLLLITGSINTMESAKVLGIDSYYIRAYQTDPFDFMVSSKIENMKDLIKILQKEEESFKTSGIYISPSLVSYLERHNMKLNTPYSKDLCQFTDNSKELSLAVTTSLDEAIILENEYNCEVCFINNHKNDTVDYAPTYEISIESVPKKLHKILSNHQK